MRNKREKRKTLSTDQKLDMLIERIRGIEKHNGIEFVEPIAQKGLYLIGLIGSCSISDGESRESDSASFYVWEKSYFESEKGEDENDYEAIYSVYADDLREAYQRYCWNVVAASTGQEGLGNHVGVWMYRRKDGKEEWSETLPLVNPNVPVLSAKDVEAAA